MRWCPAAHRRVSMRSTHEHENNPDPVTDPCPSQQDWYERTADLVYATLNAGGHQAQQLQHAMACADARAFTQSRHQP